MIVLQNFSSLICFPLCFECEVNCCNSTLTSSNGAMRIFPRVCCLLSPKRQHKGKKSAMFFKHLSNTLVNESLESFYFSVFSWPTSSPYAAISVWRCGINYYIIKMKLHFFQVTHLQVSRKCTAWELPQVQGIKNTKIAHLMFLGKINMVHL